MRCVSKIVPWSDDHQLVEGWSERRLPFEPKQDMTKFRNCMRTALRALPVGAPALIAEYRSEDPTPCDVENVLFYNVGLQPFSRLGVTQLAFSRSREAPPFQEGCGGALHYVSYRPGHLETSAESAAFAASFTSAPIDQRRIGKPWHVWHAVKLGEIKVMRRIAERESFCVRLELACAEPGAVSLFGVLKGALDGVIGALQSSATPDRHSVGVLAELLETAEGALHRLFVEADRAAVYARGATIRPFGQERIQINPADDCLAAAVVRVTSSSDGTTRLNGSVSPV